MRATTLLVGALTATATVVAVAPVATAQRSSSGPPDTSVVEWDAIGTQAFGAAALTPAEGFLVFGYTSIAVYDAVVAVEGGYQPFLVDADAPDGASAEAAVAAAAHGVLRHYLPTQAAMLDTALAADLGAMPADQATADGVDVGEAVAAAVIAARAGDGFRDPTWTYPVPNPPTPGAWLPTAPSNPIGVYLPHMEPFTLRSTDRYRPTGPPGFDRKEWERDYAEVAAVGSSTSTVRTPEQTLAARFWAEPPVQQARAAVRRFVTDRQLDLVDAARFVAMVSVSQADSFIACFDAKYHYAAWRPVTAIRAGDTDGNDATVGDPAWTPLLGTPNHPEYPSAHSCLTPVFAVVTSQFLGTDRIVATFPSLTGLGDRSFERARDLTAEVTNARVWGGIHFRFSVDDGVRIAERVAHHVLGKYFLPT